MKFLIKNSNFYQTHGNIINSGVHSYTMHQCYYCEQIFSSKEALFEHVEVHSDVERNREIMERRKKSQKV